MSSTVHDCASHCVNSLRWSLSCSYARLGGSPTLGLSEAKGSALPCSDLEVETTQRFREKLELLVLVRYPRLRAMSPHL